MASKYSNIVKLFSRNISLSKQFNHNTNRKLKLITNTDTVKKSKALDLKASKNQSTRENRLKLEKLLKGKHCSDDVYFMNEYQMKSYPLSRAITNHKDMCLDKSILDSPDSVLKANFTMNMKTKKATKFIQKIHGVVIPTYHLDFLPKPRILAFCTTPEDIEIALANGAHFAGDDALVKKLETGQIYYEEFDQVVAHTDAVSMLSKLKPILKEKFPVKGSPRIGTDMKFLVEKYVKGLEYETKKLEGITDESHLTVPLGLINWSEHMLMDNFNDFLQEINQDASNQIDGSPFTQVTLTCLPSDEVFLIDLSPYLADLTKAKLPSGKSSKAVNKES